MTTTTAVRERAVMHRWVLFIGLLFVAQVGLWIGTVIYVSRDASHAVVADYDTRALSWDERRDRQRRSDATGWHPTATVTESALVVTVRDADGTPVVGASLQATVFHHARASETTQLNLIATGNGTYRGEAAMARPGKWTVALVGERGDELLDAELTVVVED